MNKKAMTILSILMIILIGFRVEGIGNENDTNITITPNMTVNITNSPPPVLTSTPNISSTNSPIPISTENKAIITSTVIEVTTTPNVTATPIITPKVIEATTTPNIAVSPTPTPIITQNIVATPNIPNDTVETVETVTKTKSHKQKSIDTNTMVPTEKGTNISIQPVIILTSVPTATSGFFGDFYSKIILAVVLGFIGMSYEIAKINYDHKKRKEVEMENAKKLEMENAKKDLSDIKTKK